MEKHPGNQDPNLSPDQAKLLNLVDDPRALDYAIHHCRRYNLTCSPDELLQDVRVNLRKPLRGAIVRPWEYLKSCIFYQACSQVRRMVRDRGERPLTVEPVDDRCPGEFQLQLQLDEARANVEPVMDQLKKRDRALLVDLWGGMSIDEYAEKHGIPETAAQRRRQRAYKRFHKAAAEVHGDENLPVFCVHALLYCRHCVMPCNG